MIANKIPEAEIDTPLFCFQGRESTGVDNIILNLPKLSGMVCCHLN
jgi:hypothetical protein